MAEITYTIGMCMPYSDKKKRAEHHRKWYKENSMNLDWLKKYRARQNRNQKLRKAKIRAEIIKLLGSMCSKCGCGDWRVLQIDHVFGHGRKDAGRISGSDRSKKGFSHGSRRDSGPLKGYGKYLRRVLKEIQAGSNAYQLLCANCNWIKRIEKGEARSYFKSNGEIVI